MSEARFFCPDLAAQTARLTGDEARHAAVVRRLKAGDALSLFDGCGTLAQARIENVSRRGDDIALLIVERHIEPAPLRALHLACALPKGDRQAVLLDMATQLGMTHFTPLRCEHGVAQATEAASARWARIVLEACKQSRRLYLPALNPPGGPGEVASQAIARGDRVLIAHPDGERLSVPEGSGVTLMIGPEAGFTAAEVEQVLAAGARKVALGPQILRIEAAAVAMLGAMTICGG